MAKHIIKRSLLGSHIFLVFSSTCDSNIPTWLVANAVSRFISETRDTLCQTRSLSNATFSYLIMWRSTSWKSAAVYKISWKSYDFSLRYGDILIFKMAAVRHLGIVLPPYETTHEVCYWPQLPVKFHVNLIQRSEDMTIWIFFTFLAWSDYSGPKNGGFGGLWTHKCEYSSSRPPKGTSLRKSASFRVSTVKICLGVWPVGELTESVTDTHTQANLYFVHALHGIGQTMIQDGYSCYGTSVWTLMQSIEWCYFQWPLTQISRSCHYSMLNILETVRVWT